MSTSGHLLSFSLFAFVRPLDRRIELGQIKENDSRGVTTLLSVTNTSVLFLRVRPYRSGRMNGPGQFRLKQAGEKKKPRVSRFCLQKIFLPFDYEGNWVQGRAKRKWAAPSRPCIPAVKRDASAVPYAVPREKKRSRGTRPLSPPRSLRLPTRNRKTLIGWSSVRLPVLALPPSLSLPPLPPTSTTTPTLYSLSSGNGHRFSSSFFSHCIHSSPSGVFVSTALCHRHPASIPTQTPLRTVDWVVDSSCTVFRPAAVNTLRVTIAKKKTFPSVISANLRV